MSDNKNKLSVLFNKRAWPFVLFSVILLLIEIFTVQTAIASGYEREPRAALISWIFAIVLVAVYVAIWLRTAKKA